MEDRNIRVRDFLEFACKNLKVEEYDFNLNLLIKFASKVLTNFVLNEEVLESIKEQILTILIDRLKNPDTNKHLITPLLKSLPKFIPSSKIKDTLLWVSSGKLFHHKIPSEVIS